MVNGGDKEFDLSSYQFRAAQSEVGNSFMEMEGRAYTRTANEEFIMKSVAESSNKLPISTMEMSGFKNHFQIFRTDSEELFKSWITSEESNTYKSSSMVHRIPQATSRMARELNHVTPVDDENSTNLDQNSFRNVVEREVPASNPYLDKAWYHGSQPITRSRSSDLWKDYVTLQNLQTSASMGAMHDVTGYNINNPKQENENPGGFCEAPFGNVLNHSGPFVSQNSSLSNYNGKYDTEDGSFKVYGVQEVLGDMNLDQNGDRMYLELSSGHVTNDHNRVLRAVDGTPELNFEGFDALNEPMGNTVQIMATTCESSVQYLNGRNKENGTRVRAMDYMNITDDEKPKERLVRSGSVTSFDPVDEGEATKKRRVERSRKMAEAKERILTPTIPSDMQSVVKRCENLEKEVRSLKLNLAFMNRKDSEQTKQLEELQIQHDELMEVKERLLEEIERIIASR